MRPLLSLSACLVAALALTACAKDTKTTTNTASTTAGSSAAPGAVGTVNKYCLLQDSQPVNPNATRTFSGMKVGFCCNGCAGKFDQMTSLDQQKLVDAGIAKTKSGS